MLSSDGIFKYEDNKAFSTTPFIDLPYGVQSMAVDKNGILYILANNETRYPHNI